jgi:hypothetical protein
VAAATWKSIKDEFKEKPVVQFTATPYREDGKHLGGRLLYAFPLREAQRQGYFSKINYLSVLDFADPDRAIAERAVAALRQDLDNGLTHVLMARTNQQKRANELLDLYQELAPDLNPVVLHSAIGSRAREAALTALRDGTSKIILCVDMLGEGFDLPSLKIAAVHDPHKSLGVTLQFIGRFARVADTHIGDATVVVGRTSADDPRLRQLYSEDVDWNVVLQILTESEVGKQQELSEFESAFAHLPDEVSFRNIAPKMSAVVYRTFCKDWDPVSISNLYPEETLLTVPIPINNRDHVTWFVTKLVEPVRWGELQTVEQITYELFVMYWDQQKGLLYINCSDTGSVYEHLARLVCGPEAQLIKGEAVYRAMANVARLVPTNVGVLDIRNRSRRFSMHVGADVSEGFPTAEAQTKTQTNIFAYGYEDGARMSIGATLKGRVWSFRAAATVKDWVDWCDHVGAKLNDDGISVDNVMRGFVRPKVVEERPSLIPLALEWPWDIYSGLTEELRIEKDDKSCPIIDADLTIKSFQTTGPIRFGISGSGWDSDYELSFDVQGMKYAPKGDPVFVRTRRSRVSLSEYLDKSGLSVLFEDDVLVVPPGILLRPDRTVSPFDATELVALDWEGVDIRKESQGQDRDQGTVQARMFKEFQADPSWQVIIDDDGSGEMADIVAIKEEGSELVIELVHCKYSSEDTPGARVADLYEVCGQAEKCVRWRRDQGVFFQHLIRRERKRLESGRRTGLERGSGEDLFKLEERARYLRPTFQVTIAQPGLSAAHVSVSQLQLLACTQVYLYETANSTLRVICSN